MGLKGTNIPLTSNPPGSIRTGSSTRLSPNKARCHPAAGLFYIPPPPKLLRLCLAALATHPRDGVVPEIGVPGAESVSDSRFRGTRPFPVPPLQVAENTALTRSPEIVYFTSIFMQAS